MSRDEWLAAVAAARPPLTPEQLAILRPACQRMAESMRNAAPAADRQEPRTETEPEPGRNTA